MEPMKRILFLKNKIDTPSRYNYEINYGWTDVGAQHGLFDAQDWFIDSIPTREQLDAYIAKSEIDCIISLCALPRFEYFNAMSWLDLLEGVKIPKILRAADTCYQSYRDPFYQAWDHILYRMGDKNGGIPAKGTFIPWSINPEKYVPQSGGTEIKMIASCGEAYPLRTALRDLNRKHSRTRGSYLFTDLCDQVGILNGERYVTEMQTARAIITTGSKLSPETRARVLEATACGALIITPPTKHLSMYFDPDQVFIFNDGDEFVEICQSVIGMDEESVIELQERNRKHVCENHNSVKFVKERILPVIEQLQGAKR